MLKSIDAFAAVINNNGTVVTGQLINDPSSIPTVVTIYDFNNKSYKAIYHDSLDAWETFIVKDDCLEFYTIADKFSPFYEYSCDTIAAFRDKLFDWNNQEKLQKIIADKMAKDMIREIDNDIINSFHTLLGIPHKAPLIPTIVISPNVDRKLTAKWSIDTDELKDARLISVDIISTLYSGK